jgi:lysine-ketoglutarate reductase/saccharopine dehydrogenase-like protein (TIGR00300 family)
VNQPAIGSFKASGHLVDSGILQQMLDAVIREGGAFEITRFEIGRTNLEPSHVELTVRAPHQAAFERIAGRLTDLGAAGAAERAARVGPAPDDGVAPQDFYSTTHHETSVFGAGAWRRVERIRMDGVIVLGDDGASATCVRPRDLKRGQPVVVGLQGIRVEPEFVERDRSEFGFMTSDVSSERVVRIAVERVAALMLGGRRTIAVAGPVVVHTGGAPALARLIEGGFVHGLLSGNALAVHDIESQLYGTSLGIDITTGEAREGGHSNHLRAINEVRRAGSIASLIAEGRLRGGVMHAALAAGIPWALAGSVRDDGPLPETLTEMNAAQEAYARILEGAELCLMLASMLHGIATANMIPARVRTVCVDIHPAVVTKLRDRGSLQTIGVVTDAGLFLHMLADRLREGAGR